MATKKPGTQVVDYVEELRRRAKIAAGLSSESALGKWFSTRSGQLKFAGSEMDGNQMAVIILGSLREYSYYPDKFDPDSPVPPLCYALGDHVKEMKPHELVVEAGTAQNDLCAGCQFNKFGSADTGRGKACGNRVRLALISAGTLESVKNGPPKFLPAKDLAHYQTTDVALLRVPVTSVRNYDKFVRDVSGALELPPEGVFCRIELHPDDDKQFEMTFHVMDRVPNAVLGVVLSRTDEARKMIEDPGYQTMEERPAPKKRAARAPVKAALRAPVKATPAKSSPAPVSPARQAARAAKAAPAEKGGRY